METTTIEMIEFIKCYFDLLYSYIICSPSPTIWPLYSDSSKLLFSYSSACEILGTTFTGD